LQSVVREIHLEAGVNGSGGDCVSAGAVVRLRRLLAKGKGLGTAQLVALSHFVKTALAGVLILLGVHFHVILREAAGRVVLEERTVASVQNVKLGIGQLGILSGIEVAILLTNELRPGK